MITIHCDDPVDREALREAVLALTSMTITTTGEHRIPAIVQVPLRGSKYDIPLERKTVFTMDNLVDVRILEKLQEARYE